MTQFDVITALRLRGITILSRRNRVIHIDRPSGDLRRAAVDIIERLHGVQHHCKAVQFHGMTIRWEE